MTLICLISFALLHIYFIKSVTDRVWEGFLCKRLDVCPISLEDFEANIADFDALILNPEGSEERRLVCDDPDHPFRTFIDCPE